MKVDELNVMGGGCGVTRMDREIKKLKWDLELGKEAVLKRCGSVRRMNVGRLIKRVWISGSTWECFSKLWNSKNSRGKKLNVWKRRAIWKIEGFCCDQGV